jgi:predicted acylesterase/phospholipase RssA
MFGAYQAGVWEGLAKWFKPDIVVGTSIGALNGWAIAGGCPAEELVQRWLHLADMCAWKVRLPWPPQNGLLDCSRFEEIVREMHCAYRPAVRYGVVLTELARLKARLFSADIAWQHLAASCAVPGLFRQQCIGGRLYTDGGLLESLPLWAAEELGAKRILAVQVMPRMPFVLRTLVTSVRSLSGKPPRPNGDVKIVMLGPEGPIGRTRDMIEWNQELVLRWIEAGRAEAIKKRQSLQQMFCG